MTVSALIDALQPAGPWVDQAACRGADPAMWFPERKGDNGAAAVRICRDCPVRAECLNYALSNIEPFGIWGGLSVLGRRRLRKERRVA